MSQQINTAAAATESRAPAVLQVVPELQTGGVERTTVDVARALTAAGWRAVVASQGGAMVRELERAGAVHVTLPLASKNPFVMRANIGRLERVIRAQRVDIVHARSRAPAWSAFAAAERTGARFVTTFHGTYGHGSRLKRRYNAIMLRGERIIANSSFIAEHIRSVYGVSGERVVTVPRGIDIQRFDPEKVGVERLAQLARQWQLPDDLPVVLLPGRLTRWKGQTVMIEALAQLPRRDLLLLLVGDDQGRSGYRRELLNLIAQHKLEGTVRLMNHCNDMPAAYMLASVVVSASTDPEAFGRVTAEAQAMGRPVIATAHGGSLETVLDGETGWLVPPNDARALALAVDQALQMDLPTRQAVAVAARDHVVGSDFTLERMCARTLDVYAALLDRP